MEIDTMVTKDKLISAGRELGTILARKVQIENACDEMGLNEELFVHRLEKVRQEIVALSNLFQGN